MSVKNSFTYDFPHHVTEVPDELAEDSKFVPLDADEPQFGPPVSSG